MCTIIILAFQAWYVAWRALNLVTVDSPGISVCEGMQTIFALAALTQQAIWRAVCPVTVDSLGISAREGMQAYISSVENDHSIFCVSAILTSFQRQTISAFAALTQQAIWRAVCPVTVDSLGISAREGMQAYISSVDNDHSTICVSAVLTPFRRQGISASKN